MVSVQRTDKCPHCEFMGCIFDSYYRSNEMYVNCPRCGFSYSRTNRFDVEKTKQVFDNVKFAFDNGDFLTAFYLTEQHYKIFDGVSERSSDDLSLDERGESVARWLVSVEEKEFKHWYLKDKEGNVIFEEVEVKPCGAMRYKGKGAIATLCACYEDETKLIEEFEPHLSELDEAKYTKKVDGVWVMVDMLTKEVKPFKEYDEEQNG